MVRKVFALALLAPLALAACSQGRTSETSTTSDQALATSQQALQTAQQAQATANQALQESQRMNQRGLQK